MIFWWMLIFCKIKCILAFVNIICCLFSVGFVKTVMSGGGQDFDKGPLKKALWKWLSCHCFCLVLFSELEERTGKTQGEINGWKWEFLQKERGKLFSISYSLCLELDLSSILPCTECHKYILKASIKVHKPKCTTTEHDPKVTLVLFYF